MDCLKMVPGVCRLLVTVFLVMVMYQPCCEGTISGRVAVASTNRILKIGSNVRPTTRDNLLIRRTKRPSETTVVHRTRIVPSSRVISCLKLRCPASTPKECSILSIVRLRGGRRCRRCVIKRSSRCRVIKPTKNIKPTKKITPRKIKTTSKSSRRTTAKKSRIPSARMKDAVIKTRARAKVNNFEGRWKKGFSSG